MRLLVDENIPGRDCFEALGEVRTLPGRAITAETLAGIDALIVRSVTRVDRTLLAGSPVRFVGSATAGIDHVAVDQLATLGIAFAHAPGSNADSVVDYVLAVLASRFNSLGGLRSRRIGIIGYGHVGSRLGARLQALGLACRVCDPLLPQQDVPGAAMLAETLDCDIVSLHVPLSLDGDYPTWRMLDADRLALLPQGALLINSSRGEVIDETALKSLLVKRPDLSCALDVWADEPAIDGELLTRVDVATPHIAGYAWDGKLRGTRMIYEQLCAFLGRPAEWQAGEGGAPRLTLPSVPVDTLPLALVRCCYDIRSEVEAFRARVARQGVATAFDGTRRDYPRRREFSAWRLGGLTDLPPAEQSIIAALGFRVS